MAGVKQQVIEMYKTPQGQGWASANQQPAGNNAVNSLDDRKERG